MAGRRGHRDFHQRSASNADKRRNATEDRARTAPPEEEENHLEGQMAHAAEACVRRAPLSRYVLLPFHVAIAFNAAAPSWRKLSLTITLPRPSLSPENFPKWLCNERDFKDLFLLPIDDVKERAYLATQPVEEVDISPGGRRRKKSVSALRAAHKSHDARTA